MLLTLLLAWAAALSALWWLLARAQPAAGPAPAPPPDPVASEVARWMHEWDRGRA
jgi:hypothetical protein